MDAALIEQAKQKILNRDKTAVDLAQKAIAEGADPLELMNEAFIPGINEVGEAFGRGRLFLPELIGAAEVMKAVTDLVNEALAAGERERQKAGRFIIATVKGDLHDIGKCIVVSLLQANGFEVLDLGRDVDIETIIEKAVEFEADIIGTSALLTTTMNYQKILEEALKTAGLKDRYLTIVGGAPVTPRWAARIGADAYAEDAQEAVVKSHELLARKG